MKSIFMVTDLEGVAGVVSFADQSAPDGRYYDAAKKLATAEINAAVEGMLAAGVEDVLIWDGHGAGGIVFEPNPSFEEFLKHPFRDTTWQNYAILGAIPTIIVVVAIMVVVYRQKKKRAIG